MSETITAQMHTVLDMLRRLPARERLRVIEIALPETKSELETFTPTEWDEAALAAAEAALEQELLEKGLLSEIPVPYQPENYALPEPVEIPGTPLSEIIITERR